MVGKATTVSSGGAGYDYALGKDNAEIIDKQGVIADNGTELQQEFQMLQDNNTRCKNNNINLILAPHRDNGKPLNNAEWRKLSQEFMQKMGLDKQQYVVVKHNPNPTEKRPNPQPHLHIYCNRIKEDGKAIDDSYIGKKAQRVAEELGQERGWILAKDIQAQKQILDKENKKEIRQQIFNKHTEVMQIDKPRTFEKYSELMKGKGVDIKPTLNKQGKIQGFRCKYQGFDLKASQVHRNMTLSRTKLQTNAPKLHKDTNMLDVALDGLKTPKIALKTIKKAIDLGMSHSL